MQQLWQLSGLFKRRLGLRLWWRMMHCMLQHIATAVIWAEVQQSVMACRQAVPQLLKKLQLEHGKVMVESTPRRLAVMVANVQAKQEDVEERVRGPPAKV